MFFRSVVRPEGSRAQGLRDDQPKECDVIVTEENEYYVWRGNCIAVRARASGRFIRQDNRMGIASLHRGQVPRASTMHCDSSLQALPRVGEWLCLERAGVLHCVGRVLGCERRRAPQRRILASTLRRSLSD
jgi:hypothetical protein